LYATISQYIRYKTVTYYTITCDDKGSSVAEDFFARMLANPNLKSQTDQIAVWIKKVGNHKKGLEKNQLRFERKCWAIPPRKVKTDNGKKIEIRLYCHWINERIVILFNGGLKTENDPMSCPNIRMHFLQAQTWTNQIEKAGIEHNGKEITNLNDIILKC